MGKISFVLIIICTVLFSCQKEIKHEIPVLKVNYESAPEPSKVEDMQKHMQVRFQPLETQDSAYFRLKSSVVRTYKDKIFVNDMRADVVLVFDEAGRFLNRINHRGEGPEEYVSILEFMPCNDRLYVLDMRKQVQVYDFKGEYLKTIPLKKGGSQFYVTPDEHLYLSGRFNREYFWTVQDNQGNIIQEYFPVNEKLRKFEIPMPTYRTIGFYDGGVYLTNFLDYNIYQLKDTISVLARMDFGHMNIPDDFYEGSPEVVEKRFNDLRGSVKNGIKAVLSIEYLLVTDDWIVFQPGELANRGIYYNRKTGFWMTTKYFTEPYKTFLTGNKLPDGYNPETGEFYRLVSAMDLKEVIENISASDKDYLEKYPCFKGIDPQKIDDNTNEFVMFFKL